VRSVPGSTRRTERANDLAEKTRAAAHTPQQEKTTGATAGRPILKGNKLRSRKDYARIDQLNVLRYWHIHGPFLKDSVARDIRTANEAKGLRTCFRCLAGYRPVNRVTANGRMRPGRGVYYCSTKCWVEERRENAWRYRVLDRDADRVDMGYDDRVMDVLLRLAEQEAS
jgi:hypothetical protein